MMLDELVEQIATNPEAFRNGELLPPEKRAIIDPGDTWEITLVSKMPPRKIRTAGYCFAQKDPIHYEASQDKWMEKLIFFLGKELARDPTQDEIVAAAMKYGNFENHKLCYVLNFPLMVKFSSMHKKFEEDMYWFLAEAEQISRFPYFDTIRKSSGFLAT